MHISNIHETKTHLSKLINRVLAGEEVVITKGDQPLVKMVPFERDTSPRIPGFWSGQVTMAGDFDEADNEILEMFEESSVFPGEDA